MVGSCGEEWELWAQKQLMDTGCLLFGKLSMLQVTWIVSNISILVVGNGKNLFFVFVVEFALIAVF